jgi:hypothetical protein
MPTPFLWNPGPSNNGLLNPAASLMTTELQSLANNAVIISSVGGTSGVFNNSFTAQSVLADLFFNVDNPGIGIALTAGAVLSGWWLTSYDGSTFESQTVAAARAADFVIPMPTAIIAAGSVYRSQGFVTLPALRYKVLILNSTGQPFSNGATTAPALIVAPYALQY